MENSKVISTEGDFSLHAYSPVYKTYKTDIGYIRNTKTGENCGQIVKLRKYYYDYLGNRLPEPAYDEDCYEFVTEG